MMAIVGVWLFSRRASRASVWAIDATVAPRWQQIVALLDGMRRSRHRQRSGRRSVASSGGWRSVAALPARAWRAAA